MADIKEFSISEKDFIKFQGKYFGVVGNAAANARYRDSLYTENQKLSKLLIRLWNHNKGGGLWHDPFINDIKEEVNRLNDNPNFRS